MSPVGELSPWLSHSQVETLLDCGEKFRLQKVLQAPRVPAFWFIGGSAIHQVTEHMDKEVLQHGELWSDDYVYEQVRQTIDGLMNIELLKEPDMTKWRAGGKGKEDESWWRVEAPKMVIKYRDWLYDIDQDLVIWTLPNGEPAVEVEIVTTFGDVPVKMAIDRVMQSRKSGELIVVDIKAGSREPASPYQLSLYAEAVRRTFGVQVVWGSYWMARKAYLSMPKFLTPTIGELDNRFAKAKLMRDNEIFLAVPGMFCGTCDVAPYCKAVGGNPDLLNGRVS